MILGAIDPGTRAVGLAEGDETGLLALRVSVLRDGSEPADLAARHARALGARPHDLIAVESMVWRPNDPRSHPQDLLNVQTTGLLLAHALGARTILPVEPQEWKRNLPKTIHHNRLSSALTPSESLIVSRAVETAGQHAKEALDALGLLLFVLGRIDNSGRRR